MVAEVEPPVVPSLSAALDELSAMAPGEVVDGVVLVPGVVGIVFGLVVEDLARRACLVAEPGIVPVVLGIPVALF